MSRNVRKRGREDRSEDPFWGMRGQMGASLIFLFLTGLMLSSFALDSGVIYYKRSQMQQIVDSASMDGVSASVKGTSSADVQTLVGSLIQMQASNRNIELLGNPSVIVELPSATSPNTKVKVSATIRANYLMYKFLSCFSANPPASGGYSLTVKGAASTGRKPVILSMIIDVSGSMSDSMGNSSGQSKLAAAQVAMKQIVTLLNYPEDQMALISFSDFATVLQPMTTVAGNQDAINAAIDSLSANNSTDMEQGVVFGTQEMESAQVTDGVTYDRMIILLTDGCPNEVFTLFTPITQANGYFPRPALTYGIDQFGNDGTSGGSPQFFVDEHYVPAPCYQNATSGYNSTAAGLCLANGGYVDSHNVPMGAAATPPLTPGSPGLLAMGTMFQDLTIAEADYAKNFNSGNPNSMVTFYTVGLGLPDTVGSDPYEFTTSDTIVHSVLLRKLANDPGAVTDPQYVPGTSNFNPNQLTGKFFETSDTTQIAPVLQSIINAGLRTIKVTDYNDS